MNSVSRCSRRGLKKILLTYLITFGLSLWVLGGWIVSHVNSARPSLPGGVTGKTAYYLRHASDFDLVFLGDSRTYCGMHPEILDPLLGTSSVNLAIMAHWFPTQYPQIQDILSFVPPGATVVWSVGHQNFQAVQGGNIWSAYPIGRDNARRYQRWGFSFDEMRRNLESRPPLNTTLARGFGHTAGFMEASRRVSVIFWDRMGDPFVTAPTRAVTVGKDLSAEEMAARYRRDPDVRDVAILTAGGRVTSLNLRMARGGSYRIELDPVFFRSKQALRDSGKDLDPGAVLEPEEPYWNLFIGILELFSSSGVNLVVNEMEEAPHHYLGPHHRAAARRFMRDRVKPEVERLGFGYTRVSFDRLSDEDYFDYNHLNSTGIKKFSPMLAGALAPHLTGR